MVIEHAQCDVRQQRRQDAALWGAGVGIPIETVLGHHARLQERLDQGQDPTIGDAATDPIEQGRVVDPVEARLDVTFEHPVVPATCVVVNLGDRVLRPSSRRNP